MAKKDKHWRSDAHDTPFVFNQLFFSVDNVVKPLFVANRYVTCLEPAVRSYGFSCSLLIPEVAPAADAQRLLRLAEMKQQGNTPSIQTS